MENRLLSPTEQNIELLRDLELQEGVAALKKGWLGPYSYTMYYPDATQSSITNFDDLMNKIKYLSDEVVYCIDKNKLFTSDSELAKTLQAKEWPQKVEVIKVEGKEDLIKKVTDCISGWFF